MRLVAEHHRQDSERVDVVEDVEFAAGDAPVSAGKESGDEVVPPPHVARPAGEEAGLVQALEHCDDVPHDRAIFLQYGLE